MSKKSLPNRNDYYFHNGSFYLKNKWAQKFRMGFIIGLFISGALVTANAMFNTPQKVPVVYTYAVKEAGIYDYIRRINSDLTHKETNDIIMSMSKWSKKYELDISLIAAVAKVESGFQKHAISDAGALGLMQIIPSWHLNKLKVAKKDLKSPEPFDINTNIFIGSWVLSDCIDRLKDIKKALLCYNGSLLKPNGYDTKVLQTKMEIDKSIKQNT
jgi:soluble lytic murein transglycosylase-like protein